MDDSCAVCADSLEWVAYGSCGHKDVCSTCVARLRFICNDPRCCICKTESDLVFVTKALGDYTRMINDFSIFPSELKEGRVGSYWYHEDTRAIFDDLDHYRMIKAMCRLSCSVCDKMEERPHDGPKRRARFRNIEQLKGHLFHQHRLLMCSLCLEGRKVFICEQKLYTRAQLNQHINTGDSEVDGTESERGGFMGHPMCEFCRSPFYGDNELYLHLSTEHYTCHICQRQHPGQYEYYKNYDDLELHFQREHFLCEHEACLAKKFVVFQSEAELKRHNTMEHGGRMSRSKRNAALQIPTSFQYRRSNERDTRRGRRQTFHHDHSEEQLSLAIQASYETANADSTFLDPSLSITQVVSDHEDANDVNPIIQPFELLATTDSEQPSRYLQALSHKSRNAPLEESSFPPLLTTSGSSQQKPKCEPESSHRNSMAAHLRKQNNSKVTVSNSAQAWQAVSRAAVPSATGPTHARDGATGLSSTSRQNKSATESRLGPSTYSSLAQVQPTSSVHEPTTFASSRKMGITSRMNHSTSAPDLASISSFVPYTSDFPPVSATQVRKLPTSGQAMLKVEDVHATNKSLVERIRSALEFDEVKYTAFKEISGEYRQGLMDAETYLGYVYQFSLSHLVIDLARLCPDVKKQRELIEAYNVASLSNGLENGWGKGSAHMKGSNRSNKGKGKSDTEDSSSRDYLADNIISTVKKLQSSYKPSEEEVEVLTKDGYRTAKGKSKVMSDEPQAEMNASKQPAVKLKDKNGSHSSVAESNQNSGDAGRKSKPRKKTSKFHRARLGDGSVAAFLDLNNSDPDPDPDLDSNPSESDSNNRPTEALPVHGVWRNGGGHRLLAMSARSAKK
ncbi:E3 ubiquitin-protein ligase HEL2 [Diospyros lotus]|uniref:E3 ubiquitin-protein ligase HEL2 n=1 Tax=Diospyros lotus TaxID=55363 RepID=UPI0022581F37|nr:E3 ubiquitin-protein ligase HEL2 [Diospyros lotus]XP_052189532.1 E3 ubiquitin-protein ligase HEL2 [Diospyros lotus]